uniref:DUF5641 domain-containing protein n=1 Tax=Anopheles minimus TaxID=112268 RepID=A0A182W812_9DIPT
MCSIGVERFVTYTVTMVQTWLGQTANSGIHRKNRTFFRCTERASKQPKVSNGTSTPPTAPHFGAEASRNNWKKAQIITQNYWERWLKEYLPTLAKRDKCIERSDPIQPDDIVVFPDEQRVGRWLKGRVIEVYPAKDGQVRSVKGVLEVKGSKKIADAPAWGVKRPVNIAY